MTLRIHRRDALTATRALVAEPARLADALAGAADAPAPVVEFLAALRLFQGVPFSYLVPDEAALPNESIRFFQVDPNWAHALLDGAASTGVTTTADASHDAVRRPDLHTAARATARKLRTRNLARDPAPLHAMSSDSDPEPPADPDVGHSGFLLRSAVVTGWPGLQVTARSADGTVLNVLRMDVLGPSTLLFIADGLIASVDIHEPSEGLHFGLGDGTGKRLRAVTSVGSQPPGTLLPNTPVPVKMREGDVVRVHELASALQGALRDAHANTVDGSDGPFTSAEFALEMVEGAASVAFVKSPASPAAGEAVQP
jgi:hypothetical protein